MWEKKTYCNTESGIFLKPTLLLFCRASTSCSGSSLDLEKRRNWATTVRYSKGQGVRSLKGTQSRDFVLISFDY